MTKQQGGKRGRVVLAHKLKVHGGGSEREEARLLLGRIRRIKKKGILDNMGCTKCRDP